MTSPSKLHVAVAGSTERTVRCVQALYEDERCAIDWVLTPQPKPIGRKKTVTPSATELWATSHDIAHIHVGKRIDSAVKKSITDQVSKHTQPDFFLVVDFGYLIPEWLLAVPRQHPINIHPSRLPRWRGSSPGQFVLLHGEAHSAVSIIIMDEQLDHGPVVASIPFVVEPDWTQQEYYTNSFTLASTQLPDVLQQLSDGMITPQAQPDKSPTPIASHISKQDGYISWELVHAALNGLKPANIECSALLQGVFARRQHDSVAEVICDAQRALHPWPGLWTTVKTAKGTKRLKLIACQLTGNKLIIEHAQIEGKPIQPWDQILQQISA